MANYHRYRSRSKVIARDTPSHASDHLCQIWKESIQNSRSYSRHGIWDGQSETNIPLTTPMWWGIMIRKWRLDVIHQKIPHGFGVNKAYLTLLFLQKIIIIATGSVEKHHSNALPATRILEILIKSSANTELGIRKKIITPIANATHLSRSEKQSIPAYITTQCFIFANFFLNNTILPITK